MYEIYLEEGTWTITLENTSGTVDWGLTFHPSDQEYMSKTDAYEEAAAWFEPGGMGEQVTFTLAESGYHAVTVWKVGTADLEAAGSYTLQVTAGAPSPVEQVEIPAQTRLAGIFPNPFNPQTTVEFDLARSGLVEVGVYDLTGRKVATLVKETYPAGRHRKVWPGHDDFGRQVASGMYVIRLQTNNTTDLKKVMLVK